MRLSYEGLQDKEGWKAAGVALPKYDWKTMCENTEKAPVWVHFGAGNIFRGFIAGLQQYFIARYNIIYVNHSDNSVSVHFTLVFFGTVF